MISRVLAWVIVLPLLIPLTVATVLNYGRWRRSVWRRRGMGLLDYTLRGPDDGGLI